MEQYQELGIDTTGSSYQKIDPNLLKDDNPTLSNQKRAEESSMFISAYVKLFIIGSILIILNILLMAGIFSHYFYITQTAQPKVDEMFVDFIPKYEGYLKQATTSLGKNKEALYSPLTLASSKDLPNLNKIIGTADLSYAEKKKILNEKITPLPNTILQTIKEIDTLKKDIAKYGFLPLEIREILEDKQAISSIQRSLNSLEIIKFTAALKVFSFLDTTASMIGDMINMSKEKVLDFLAELANREEKDVSTYVHMCYLNPFETAPECESIADVDRFYEYVLQDRSFNLEGFKLVMGAIDKVLEQNDIPSFSIIFNNFNALQQAIDFNIEVNTAKNDEERLIVQGIKNPHIFILTNLINLLKQSIFVIGAEINTKTLDIHQRKMVIDDIEYIVNTSSKQFNLPIQKHTAREIFDYLEVQGMVKELLSASVESGSLEEVSEELANELGETMEGTGKWEGTGNLQNTGNLQGTGKLQITTGSSITGAKNSLPTKPAPQVIPTPTQENTGEKAEAEGFIKFTEDKQEREEENTSTEF